MANGSTEAQDDSQPFLFCGSEIPQVNRERPQWNCTGEFLKKHRPAVYQCALDMLCEPGVSIRSICRTLHISHNTLASIQEREQTNLDTRKKVVLNTVTRGLRLCAERVEELAPTMTARDALIGVGIMGEKMQLLRGDVTQRIESFEHVDVIARFQEFCRELEKRVEARQLATEIGLFDGNKLPNSGDKDAIRRAPEPATNALDNASGTEVPPQVTLALPPPNCDAR